MLQTPSQTVGPYFAYGLTPEQYLYDFKSLAYEKMVNSFDSENTITIIGKVFDGQGLVIPDALVEIWQNTENEQLFGRFGTGTDAENRFIFYTKKPNSVEGQAPFLSVILFMRGQLIHLYTRIYFADEEELNNRDMFLNNIPKDRRNTLLARKKGTIYEFNIYMQGENETVFFDI